MVSIQFFPSHYHGILTPTSPAHPQHGVKRIRLPPVPDSAEIERKRLEKEAIKIKQYQELLESLYAKVRLSLVPKTRFGKRNGS